MNGDPERNDQSSKPSVANALAGIVVGAITGVLFGCSGVYAFLWITVPAEMRRPHEWQGLGHWYLMLIGSVVGGIAGLALGFPLMSLLFRSQYRGPAIALAVIVGIVLLMILAVFRVLSY